MSDKTDFARVKSAAYEPAANRTAVTIHIPGKHDLQPGELVAITTRENQ